MTASAIWVLQRLGEEKYNDPKNAERVSLNAAELQRLFPCPVHGKVVPLADRHDCPYCMPYDPDESPWWEEHARFEYARLVPLNPS